MRSRTNPLLSRRAFTYSLSCMAGFAAVPAMAQDNIQTSSISSVAPKSAPKLATRTEILIGRNEVPMVSPGSVEFMESAIALYEEFVAGGGWPNLPAKTLKKGARGNAVLALRHRLVAENYLPFESLTADSADQFDDELFESVRAFQINHGVLPSGIVAEKTLAALNVPAETRLHMLRENLPRVQTYAEGLGDRYILVNIPGTQLETVQYGTVYSRHNVVVGKLERPSPALMSKVSDINFNPYWKIPASIVERDIVPHYLEDPSYLASNHIRVFDGVGGPEIDPSLVDWYNTLPDRYFFRQEPGAHNSLGTVKINFPNEHMVYMHDTPHRELFGRNVRFESSGCVRIDQVRDVVNWVLDGDGGMDEAQYEMILASAEPYDLKISNGPDVRFMYLTAWATEDGRINFRNDIYGLDGSGFILGQPEPRTY
ncbi:MAG: L,D-transpeptidase family protein [Alphaproteobacteria bacterium]|nr:L,D-transpeptidase family protein [Alphaproteobacteria bacterium]